MDINGLDYATTIMSRTPTYEYLKKEEKWNWRFLLHMIGYYEYSNIDGLVAFVETESGVKCGDVDRMCAGIEKAIRMIKAMDIDY